MNIIIRTIEHNQQRYDTVGDWQYIDDVLVIHVSKLQDKQYEFLIALHELVEAFLCKEYGITQHEVDNFDLDHLESIEPGNLPNAPYFRQHLIATVIESIVAKELDVDWDRYEEALEKL